MSIRHIVLWKLSADDADTRALHAEQIAERLSALDGVIDEIQHIEVGRNVVNPQSNWDVALVSEFADVDALERYQAFCDARGISMLEATFAWFLSKPVVSSVIAGATSPEQVRANAAAATAWTPSGDDLVELDGILPLPADPAAG